MNDTVSPKQKQLHLVYDEDHDGVLAAAICLAMGPFNGFAIKTYPVTDKAVCPLKPETLGPCDVVVMADLSWNRELMDSIYHKVAGMTVYEHHPAAYHELRSAPYLNYKYASCSAKIAYETYQGDYYGPSQLVEIVNAYDTWKKDHNQFSWETVLAFHLGTMSKLNDLAWWTSELKKSIGLGGLPTDVVNEGMVMLRDLEDQTLSLRVNWRSQEFDFTREGVLVGLGIVMPDELRPRGIVTDLVLHDRQFSVEKPSNEPTYNMVLLWSPLGDKRYQVRVSTSWAETPYLTEKKVVGIKALEVAQAFGAPGSHYHTSGFQVDFDGDEKEFPEALVMMLAEKLPLKVELCPF